MQIINIRGKKYRVTKILKSGVFSEVPGQIIGGKILTDGFGGTLKVFDARTRDGDQPLLELQCEEGRQEREEIFQKIRRYEGGLAATLEGENAEAEIYHEPFDFVSDIHRILELLEKQATPQWVHKYTELLDTAKADKLIEEFPTEAKYLYVQSNTGTVTLKFHSQNEPTWTIATRDSFRMPFSRIFLTWTAQATKKLIFYVSNKEIKRSTLS